MATRQRRKSPFTRFILPLLSALFLGYFGFHAFNGDHGLIGYQMTEQKIAERKDELAKVRAKRERLQLRVTLLGQTVLDQETVDEFARFKLNVAHPHDVIIMLR